MDIISLVIGNEQNVNSEQSDSKKSVAQFDSKPVGDILNKINDFQNLIFNMDACTERALGRIN